jgi:hypothetical protein
VLAAIFARAGNYSFVQGNLIWLVTLPMILFAPNTLPANVRRNFAIALGGYRRGGPPPGISLVSNKTGRMVSTHGGVESDPVARGRPAAFPWQDPHAAKSDLLGGADELIGETAKRRPSLGLQIQGRPHFCGGN